MYLRKMGSVSLLTREGEVEIAKRIEDGERRVLQVVLNSSVPSRRSWIWRQAAKAEDSVKEVVKDADEDDAEFDEAWHVERVCKIIDKVPSAQGSGEGGGKEQRRRFVRIGAAQATDAGGGVRTNCLKPAGDAPQQEAD